jgi:hypothetical protein
MGKILAMFVGLVVLTFAVWKYDSSHTEDEALAAEAALKNDVDANLRPGASREDVEKILDAHGLTQHDYMNIHNPVVGMDGGSGGETAQQGPFGNMIHQCTVDWIFFFDPSDRYMRYRDDARCKSTLTTSTRDRGQPMRPGVDQPAPDPFRKEP